jgi:hypothetical protein
MNAENRTLSKELTALNKTYLKPSGRKFTQMSTKKKSGVTHFFRNSITHTEVSMELEHSNKLQTVLKNSLFNRLIE